MAAWLLLQMITSGTNLLCSEWVTGDAGSHRCPPPPPPRHPGVPAVALSPQWETPELVSCEPGRENRVHLNSQRSRVCIRPRSCPTSWMGVAGFTGNGTACVWALSMLHISHASNRVLGTPVRWNHSEI